MFYIKCFILMLLTVFFLVFPVYDSVFFILYFSIGYKMENDYSPTLCLYRDGTNSAGVYNKLTHCKTIFSEAGYYIESDRKCIVCLEKFFPYYHSSYPLGMLPCGHKVCLDCYKRLRSCPMCRNEDVTRIFVFEYDNKIPRMTDTRIVYVKLKLGQEGGLPESLLNVKGFCLKFIQETIPIFMPATYGRKKIIRSNSASRNSILDNAVTLRLVYFLNEVSTESQIDLYNNELRFILLQDIKIDSDFQESNYDLYQKFKLKMVVYDSIFLDHFQKCLTDYNLFFRDVQQKFGFTMHEYPTIKLPLFQCTKCDVCFSEVNANKHLENCKRPMIDHFECTKCLLDFDDEYLYQLHLSHHKYKTVVLLVDCDILKMSHGRLDLSNAVDDIVFFRTGAKRIRLTLDYTNL
uniref:PxGV-Corf22 protein n=2 Tax=Plutella xylostella granulovirus TaxID=98383 RepID=A0A142DVL6_9BBAC|nr:PxGV-Corf22 protein [Plutella xylostella granulovirus]